ncbi:MAG: ATP synthase subunit I [Terriglobales bacterium]
MPDPLQPDESSPNPAADVFYDGAMGRIRRFMIAIGIGGMVATLFAFGWRVAAGVLLGCVVAWANFVWLKQAVTAVAEKVTQTGRGVSGGGTVAKFVLRYALIGVMAYVIFLSSRQSLWGFFGGLFVGVAAILCEAAYEAFVALRRGL